MNEKVRTVTIVSVFVVLILGLSNGSLAYTSSQSVIDNEINNSTLGMRLSTFMQSTTGQTEVSVETGVWEAAYAANNSKSYQHHRVTKRIHGVRTRLERLRSEKQQLIAAKRNGTISTIVYRARISHIVGQIAGTADTIDRLNQKTRRQNGSVTDLAELQAEFNRTTGPEVRRVAQSLEPGEQRRPDWIKRGQSARNNKGNQGQPPANNQTAHGQGRGNKTSSSGDSPPDESGNNQPEDNRGGSKDNGKDKKNNDKNNTGNSDQGADGSSNGKQN